MLKLLNQPGIYKITNLKNKKVYIGKSVSVKKRIKHHKWALLNKYHGNSHLQNSYDKYGKSNFIFEAIHYCKAEELPEIEGYYIDYYNALDRKKGYNKKDDREKGNTIFTEEMRENISKAQKKRFENPEERKKRSQSVRKAYECPIYKANAIKRLNDNRHLSNKVNSIKIKSIDNTGNVVFYNNARIAEKQTNVTFKNINQALRGASDTAGGYRWEYVDKDKQEEADKKRKERKLNRKKKPKTPVYRIDIITGEKTYFETTLKANKETPGSNAGSIYYCCKGVNKSHAGYHWEYAH